MVKIQANASGTRSIDISEEHIETIRKYELLENIVDSNGIIDETVLEKLRLHVRAILETQKEVDRQLLDLCLDVIYNSNMKAFALNKLIELVGRKQ
ncbi:MAG: hypothetical protein IJ928_10275 [Prevotella sp.]|nr:hypothetical protein [Prevotella sp.]